MKTFWIDRFDHILSRDEFDNQAFMSVVDLKDGSKELMKLYLEAEQNVLAFLMSLVPSFGNCSLVIERQHLHQIVPTPVKYWQWLNELERVTFYENTPPLAWQVLFEFALREQIRLTIQTPEYCLRTGYDLALFVQTSEEEWLKTQVADSALTILSKTDEEEHFWQTAQNIHQAFAERQAKVKGLIYGMALGDGLGAPAEFLTIDEIKTRSLSSGFLHANNDVVKITDDTQMAFAVAQALHESEDYTPAILEKNLRNRFVEWLNDPENNRAPGMTCLTSCERLEKGMPWQEATNKGSKGCGANMRVLPVGLLRTSAETVSQVAQFQAALTHAHPTALAAAELTAMASRLLLEGTEPKDLLSALFAHAREQMHVYHQVYLGQIWDRPPFDSPQVFISTGWQECIDQLENVRKGLENFDPNLDPCAIGGAGWTAEESLATALYCFLSAPNDPLKVLQRAVHTSGDSDSIACLAGGFVGIHNGINALPKHWLKGIDYQKQLSQMSRFLD
jgi:ADP-ribosylglycohydrolase